MTTNLAAQVSPTGMVAPNYQVILQSLMDSMRSIYGQDIYLGDDSQDYEFLALIASAINDANQMAVNVYNSFPPTFAQGAGLSAMVKLNGLKRNVATYSTAPCTVGGDIGTAIENGVARDSNGNLWNLPALVSIDNTGSAAVTVTAQQLGNVEASIGTITEIYTPVYGWRSITNTAAATPGAPVETDAALRQRQTKSVALPSQTLIESINSEVGNVEGVTRFEVFENDTASTNLLGIPAHSIAVVVEGGDLDQIAAAINRTKPPGIQTFGTTSITVYDSRGLATVINFIILSVVTVTVDITIKALTGYVATTGTAIKAAVSAFVSSLDIGEYSYLNRLFGPANLQGESAITSSGLTQPQLDVLSNTYNVLAITQSRTSNPPDTTVTGGPFATGATSIGVASNADMYVGQTIQFTLDDATTFNTVVQSIGTGLVGILPAVPTSRNIPNGSDVYLISDIKIEFNESAEALPADINLSVL